MSYRRNRSKATRYRKIWRKLNRRNARANSDRHFGRKGKRSQNKHHILNKCRGGDFSAENLSWLNVDKHNNFHRIFLNSDPEYIIMALDRWMKMKGYNRFRGVRVVREGVVNAPEQPSLDQMSLSFE